MPSVDRAIGVIQDDRHAERRIGPRLADLHRPEDATIEGRVFVAHDADATGGVEMHAGHEAEPQGQVGQRPHRRPVVRFAGEQRRVDEALAAHQSRAQHVAEDLHDRPVGLVARDMVDAHGADELAVDEDCELVAVRRSSRSSVTAWSGDSGMKSCNL